MFFGIASGFGQQINRVPSISINHRYSHINHRYSHIKYSHINHRVSHINHRYSHINHYQRFSLQYPHQRLGTFGELGQGMAGPWPELDQDWWPWSEASESSLGYLGLERGRQVKWMAISGTDWLEVPTIYKAYFWGLCNGISPQNMANNIVQYLQFRILKFPLMKEVAGLAHIFSLRTWKWPSRNSGFTHNKNGDFT